MLRWSCWALTLYREGNETYLDPLTDLKLKIYWAKAQSCLVLAN